MIVVKVGGSLYDLPDLRQRLAWFLGGLSDPDWLLVPGGGGTADVVRAFDRDHKLGPERSHWLALQACSLNAHFLHTLVPGARMVVDPCGHRGAGILDPLAFVQQEDGQPGCLPHLWEATSDSVAARVAQVCRAELILLKSTALGEGMSWQEAAQAGYVDPVFPEIVRKGGLRVRAVNFRAGFSGADR